MKTALILTGHMRCWQMVFPNTKKYILDRFNPDVFISTWDNEGYWVSDEKDDGTGVSKSSPSVDPARIVDTYQAKVHVSNQAEFIEEAKSIAKIFQPIAGKTRVVNALGQFYKIVDGISMMENYCCYSGVQYDQVIRMRPDLLFHADLPSFDWNRFNTIPHRNDEGKGTGDMFMASNEVLATQFRIGLTRLHEFMHAYKMKRFCPHLITEKLMRSIPSWDYESTDMIAEWNIPKTIQHTPNGQYKDA